MIIIAHRLSTVRKLADEIVVMDGTGIAEQGSHDDLIARGGWYAEMARLQAVGTEPDDGRAWGQGPGAGETRDGGWEARAGGRGPGPGAGGWMRAGARALTCIRGRLFRSWLG